MTERALVELADLRVVVVGSSLAGRLLGRILADQGAAVTCVTCASLDRPEGPPVGPTFPVVADLDDPDRGAFGRLLDDADLLVDALPDGSLASLGYAVDDLCATRPSLLVHELRPYPAGVHGDVATEWAIAAQLGFHRVASGRDPEILPIPLASAYGALYGAVHVAAALLQRDRGIPVGQIGTSVFASSLMTLTVSLCDLADHSFVDDKGPFRAAGDLRYLCADGVSVQITSNVPSVAVALFSVLGHDEWLDEALADLSSEGPERDEALWQDRLRSVFSTRPAAEWEALISAAGGACARCRTSEEWLAEPHARLTGILVDDPAGLRVGPIVRLTDPVGDATTATAGPAGIRLASEVAEAAASGGSAETSEFVLDGVRVVELSVILAAPSGGRALAELGADVVKVDAPFRAKSPYIGQRGWLDVNRSKQSILLDLRTEDGRDILWRLIDEADVVIQGYRTDKIAALGFGPEAVHARNPRVVYVTMNSYDFGGPLSDRPGWEPLAQAVTGLHLAPDDDGVPPRIPLPLDDFGTGLVCAFGALLGLRSARRTGRGVAVSASLTRTATFFSQTEFGRADGEAPRYLGGVPVIFRRCGATWLAVEATPSTLDAVAERDHVVATALDGGDVATVITKLRAEGVAAVEARRPTDLLRVPDLHEVGLLRSWEHPHWGAVTQAFPEATAVGIAHRPGWPSSDPGEDTMRVLAGIGIDGAGAASLVDAGVVAGRIPLY